MSINTFNPKTGQWEAEGTTIASGIKILDASGYYDSEDVEGALREIKENFRKCNDDIKYIYENGTIGGGGGGGGGSAMPSITLESEETVVCTTDDIVKIRFFYQSPNQGVSTVYVTIDEETIQYKINKQGAQVYEVGPFDSDRAHNISIFVMDAALMISTSIYVTVLAGALELTSDFNPNIDFTLEDSIVVPFRLTSINPTEAVSYKRIINNNEEIVEGHIGNDKWEIGKFEFIGPQRLSIQAFSATLESNILSYEILITDADSLFMSSNFDQKQFLVGKRVAITYRISMKGERKFRVKRYIDGMIDSTVESLPMDVWDVGTELSIGEHTLELQAYTMDGKVESNKLAFHIRVVSEDYIPFEYVRDGLVAAFSAEGKSNNDMEQRGKWIARDSDDNPCEYEATLYGFNYSTNGWIDNHLAFNGHSYATINYNPFADNIPDGFTFEIFYEITNIGDIDGKVLWCKNNITPFQGMSIDTQMATISSTLNRAIEGFFRETTMVRQTFVVDRENRRCILYTNGVIAKVMYLDTNEGFRFPDKIYLGAGLDDLGKVVNNACCKIKNIRIYNRNLNHEEVLQNHIADIKDKNEQLRVRTLNYDKDVLPEMNIEGDISGMSGETEKMVNIIYTNHQEPSKTFIKQALLSWQGTSSLEYPIKNYTIKLRDGGSDYFYTAKDGWKAESRYTLKADFMESSHCNNVSIARYVEDFFRLNSMMLPTIKKDPTCRATIDGFPIKLTLNGTYLGIYNFNLDRYSSRTYGYYGEPNCVAYEIGVNSNGGAGAFADDSWVSVSSEFEFRYHYSGDEDAVTVKVPGQDGIVTRQLKPGYHNALWDLVKWVKNSSNEEFDAELGDHFQLDNTGRPINLIDYYLIVYVFGLIDSLGKNSVWFTLGEDEEGYTKWYASFYDMDSCLSLDNSGQMLFGPDIDTKYGHFNTSNSLLWSKLTRLDGLFWPMVKQRYADLRNPLNGVDGKAWFSAEKILEYIGGYIENLGQRHYNIDAEVKYFINPAYTNMCNGTRLEYTKKWVDERLLYLDSIFEINAFLETAIIRINITGKVKIKLKTYSPMEILISFSDSQDPKSKVRHLVSRHNKDDPEGWYTFEGEIQNLKDNNIKITGAPHLMYIGDMDQLFISNMIIDKAEKLVEVDVHGSKYLQRLDLGKNRLLQKVDCGDCVNLGSITEYRTLDLSECIYLKYLDIKNTSLSTVQFNKVGGVLEYLNMSNTNLTSFNLIGQEYLEEATLINCRHLAEVNLERCNALTTVELPNSKLNKFTVVDCNKMTTVDISNTGYLTTLELDGCPNLASLKMAGCTNPAISHLDLTSLENITVLDVSRCDNLRGINFASTASSITSLKVESSGIIYTYIGRKPAADPWPDYVDLTPFRNINYISFNNCRSLTRVKGISLNGGGYKLFYRCSNLTTIEGSLTLSGDCSYCFDGCSKLENWCTMNLSGVTNSYNMFSGCILITLDRMTSYMRLFSSKLSSAVYTWNGCTGIITDDEHQLSLRLFETCTGLRNADRFFAGCSKMNGQLPIPDEKGGLLDPLINVTHTSRMFVGTGLGGFIPPKFFKEGTKNKLIDADEMFNGCKLLLMPRGDIFKYCPALNRAESFLGGNSTIVGTVPEGLFDTNLGQNNNLMYLESFFGSANILGTIPDDLFRHCVKLKECTNMFKSKGISGEIPANLFENCIDLEYADSMFEGCSNLIGSIPPTLFDNNNKLIGLSNFFKDCVGLGGVAGEIHEIPSGLLRNKTRLVSINGMFEGCTGLVSDIPTEFLRDCTSLTRTSRLFKNCNQLANNIPETLFDIYDSKGNLTDVMLAECVEMFYGCTNLTGSIPAGLFKGCLLVQNMSGMFYNCKRLTGPIPPTLFENCYSVLYMSSIFCYCYSLGKNDAEITKEDPYAIPPELFRSCVKLISLTHAFNMYDNDMETTPIKGELPSDLFLTNGKLESISHIFACNWYLTGELNDTLLSRCPKLKNLERAFWATGLNAITSRFITDEKNPDIDNLYYTFSSSANLSGAVPSVWIYYPGANRTGCFSGLTPEKITNYDDIPLGWR